MTIGRKLATGCCTALLAAGSVAGPAGAEFDRPPLNLYGVTGAVDMPTALEQPEGELSGSVSHFGNITRGTLTFQALPWLQGSFRYSQFSGLRLEDNPGYEDYLDRSFDVSVRLLSETRWRPALKLGLQDLAGTGISSGEYLVATKTFGGDLALSAGLGWGRLGSYNPAFSTGTREPIDNGRGGNFNVDQWFRGDAAPFASAIWQATPRLSLMAEYSSDAYDLETGNGAIASQRILDRDSPLNFGAVYRVNDAVTVGGYYLYGSEFGVSLTFQGNPNRPPVQGQVIRAPGPVAPRPSRASAPEKWIETWAARPTAQTTLLGALERDLAGSGIDVESLQVQGPNTVEVRIRNQRYGMAPQAIGRTARALSRTMPSSVETFRIVPSSDGLPLSAIVMRRSDLEALVLEPDASAQLFAATGFADPPARDRRAALSPSVFPRFDWSVGPYVRRVLFEPEEPLRLDVGVRAQATYEPRPGLVFSGSVTKRIAGNLSDSVRQSNSVLPRVRTNFNLYNEQGDPALEKLTGAYYFKPGDNLYGRVTVGYLERMFGGLSTELLWKPVGSRLALGAELNYVHQRDFDTQFGFQDYSVATGHLSAYYKLPEKFHVQLDVGRYLAGDVGATLSLHREFANGWRIGVFATKTDVSAEEFGEGSFDKGITLEIPVGQFLGRPSKTTASTTLRPITRDGGARLEVDGRLYDRVRDYHRPDMQDSWGTVWR
ncbi:YjbH domain-containing protein [Palleronia pelagia]|uniref:Exopolysaccharide biosynthesis protein YbjH n=1 Tax=Palleronia pelagia TaxID=387096 RepID=A0A1H8GU06_9RHOB|nr:YjbH domain-containing protein [Palleronia pelagia]SEN47436.1 Exopolysaccharide biosynthesis protein YbjH [Palleronia pelagia]